MRLHVCRLLALASVLILTTPLALALDLDLNSFRAQHHRPRLAMSADLAGAAKSKARELAGKGRLDHSGFTAWARLRGSASAENVLVGCADEGCAIAHWARSGGHRANMLRRDVTHYGLASADGAKGRRYWVLELGGESAKPLP